MQIIESSPLGVRSARLQFKHKDGRPAVTLFPMVHVGEAAFYATVYPDAFDHDVVLVEGLRSPITTRITRSYRWLVGAKRLGLSLQPKSPDSGTCRARIVHADLSHDEFVVAWRKVPAWLRLLLYVGAALYGLHSRVFATRQSLAESLALDDQPSQKELLNFSPEGAILSAAILDARDERLIERLRAELIAVPTQAQSLAIVYGARHMRAVIRELTQRQGYGTGGADWLTVFRL